MCDKEKKQCNEYHDQAFKQESNMNNKLNYYIHFCIEY